ncbi:MAG TPA: hypothetical protein VFU22_11990 [Roseiflexaceae bacterium]|nr:hypothetical protein [Roseiflexaceae bacterium]
MAPPILAAAIFALFFVNRRSYLWLLKEWRPIELLQVLFYGLAALVALRVALRLWRDQQRLIAVLYLFAGIGLLFISGEEVSWGQPIFRRIFSWWPDRDALRNINVQGETTIHNLRSVRGVFNWLFLAIALYGVCSPLLFRFGRWRDNARLRLLALPAVTLPAFLLTFAFMIVRLFIAPFVGLLDSQGFMRYKEVTELTLAFGIWMFTWLNWRWLSQPVKQRVPALAGSSTEALHHEQTAWEAAADR